MMRLWIIKAVVQKGISFLPWSHRINYFFQKYGTGGVKLSDEHFGLKLQHAQEHLEVLHQQLGKDPQQRILELGTGWYPVIPMLFHLTGSGRVRSLDIRAWMTRDTQQLTLLKFRDWKERGLLDELWPLVDEKRWNTLMELADQPLLANREEFNERIGLEPVVGDARQLSMEGGSVDFICSNNTFEHIPEGVLRQILREFMRVLKPGGYMNHFIDMSDHFAHFDSSITIYNFLKFSERQWRWIDNSIQPQNRMRLSDFRRMYGELKIGIEEELPREGDVDALHKVKLHPMWSGYAEEDLATSHVTLLSRKD